MRRAPHLPLFPAERGIVHSFIFSEIFRFFLLQTGHSRVISIEVHKRKLPREQQDILTTAFMAFRDRLKLKASRILKDADEAEDVLQEAFIRLWSKKYSLSSVSQAAALAGTAVKNESLNRARKKKGEPLDGDIGIEYDDGVKGALEKEELIRRIDLLAETELSSTQRHIIRRKEYEGAKLEDIAKELGMEAGAVRMQLSRARIKLREIYRRDYGDEHDT